MRVCINCGKVMQDNEARFYYGEYIHACGPDTYDRAVKVEGHNCQNYQEPYCDATGQIRYHCRICYILEKADF